MNLQHQRKLNYLKTISSEITLTDDVEGLLIGNNCMKALEPLRMIASNNGGPCAYQPLLGWCIVEPTSNMPSYLSARYNK